MASQNRSNTRVGAVPRFTPNQIWRLFYFRDVLDFAGRKISFVLGKEKFKGLAEQWANVDVRARLPRNARATIAEGQSS
jgi:hypothetical protein